MKLLGRLREQQVKPVEKKGPRKAGKNQPAPEGQRSVLEIFRQASTNEIGGSEEQNEEKIAGCNEV